MKRGKDIEKTRQGVSPARHARAGQPVITELNTGIAKRNGG
jgi:hypothetical protein